MSNISRKYLEENETFLDEIATKVMEIYLQKQSPRNFGESVLVSKLSYRQAIAMLEAKKDLPDILNELNDKDGRTRVRQVEDGESGRDTRE